MKRSPGHGRLYPISCPARGGADKDDPLDRISEWERRVSQCLGTPLGIASKPALSILGLYKAVLARRHAQTVWQPKIGAATTAAGLTDPHTLLMGWLKTVVISKLAGEATFENINSGGAAGGVMPLLEEAPGVRRLTRQLKRSA